MQKIILAMRRKPAAEELIRKLRERCGCLVVCESDHEKAEDCIRSGGADTVLIEISETGKYDFDYCMALCSRIKEPNRKIFILCSEQDEPSVSAVITAKRQGLINDFIFFDVSVEYIISKITLS
jgi:DNA-binding NarL/FixJ family response regulator